MKILLVEDDKKIATNIKRFLQFSENWTVDIAATLQEAEKKLEKNKYDFVILDVMLPDWESYHLARQIKKRDLLLPIIFLTAKGELEDKLSWFDSGGDDYITKPFEMAELVARVKAILSRYGVRDNIVLANGRTLDLTQNKVVSDHWELSLNKTQSAILKYMLSQAGKIANRTDLIEYVWGEDAIWDQKSDQKLDVYMANLRKILGEWAIETIKGVWYKILLK